MSFFPGFLNESVIRTCKHAIKSKLRRKLPAYVHSANITIFGLTLVTAFVVLTVAQIEILLEFQS